MKRSELKRKSELRGDPEKVRAFLERGRASSARSLSQSRGRSSNKAGGYSRKLSFTPASAAQRAKVKDAACAVCGREASAWLAIDAAHLCARARGGCDSELCVIPLCRAGDGSGCHRSLDDGELDALPHLVGRYGRELAHALEHYDGDLLGLLQRLTGKRFVEAGRMFGPREEAA